MVSASTSRFIEECFYLQTWNIVCFRELLASSTSMAFEAPLAPSVGPESYLRWCSVSDIELSHMVWR